MIPKTFLITERLWRYPGESAWHFISVPVTLSQEIEFYFSHLKRGWGSLPVMVSVKNVTWNTSIFADKKTGTYLLPIKAEIRKKAALQVNDELQIEMTVTA
jgi:hypothetical protein